MIETFGRNCNVINTIQYRNWYNIFHLQTVLVTEFWGKMNKVAELKISSKLFSSLLEFEA
jgi:hypothetical protein